MNFKNFHIGIKAVILKDNKALVLKEILSDQVEGYDLPGGRLEEGESIERGLIRELKEELDLDNFVVENLLHVFERKDYNKNGSSLMLLFYKVRAQISEVKLSNEHINHTWVSREDLETIIKNKEHINDGIIKALKKVLE